MYTESLILEKVIRNSVAVGLPVLTVHDSVIVPYTKSRWMQVQMKQAAEEVLGRALPLEPNDVGLDLDHWQDAPAQRQLNYEVWRETERCESYL